MPDMHSHWLDSLQRELDALSARGRRRRLRTMTTLPNHRIEVEGRTYLNLASNDYLGFGCDETLHHEFVESLKAEKSLTRLGFTASASRLLSGEHPALASLESLLADLYDHGRDALLFNSGYHANIGILPALTGRDDLILSDRLIHASLVDGIRLCRCKWSRFRHNDLDHLRSLLAKEANHARRIFIIVESVYSMDGDVADLQSLAELKRQYDAVLYVDEAHATGVFGPQGLGRAAEQQLVADVDILVGTFGKALASTGAYAVMDAKVKQYLVNTARSLIFTTALPPVCVWWSEFVLRRSIEATEKRKRLQELAAQFRQRLGNSGPGTQIVPLLVGEDQKAVKLSNELRSLGYWVPPIRPPTVPEGTARLRFSLGAGMSSEEAMELASDALRLRESL